MWRDVMANQEIGYPLLFGRAEVGGAVAEKSGGGDGLRKYDADGDKDSAAAGSIRNSDFEARAFGILIAAAESDATFGEVFADGDFFLKAASADAGENARFYARAISARNDALFERLARGGQSFGERFGEDFHPNGRCIAKFAEPRDAFTDFEGAQFQ